MELVFFGVIVPPVLAFVGYQLLRRGEAIAPHMAHQTYRHYIDRGWMDGDRAEGTALLFLWATGLALIGLAVFFPLRILYMVLFE